MRRGVVGKGQGSDAVRLGGAGWSEVLVETPETKGVTGRVVSWREGEFKECGRMIGWRAEGGGDRVSG